MIRLNRILEVVFMVQLGRQSEDTRVYGISCEVARTPGFNKQPRKSPNIPPITVVSSVEHMGRLVAKKWLKSCENMG